MRFEMQQFAIHSGPPEPEEEARGHTGKMILLNIRRVTADGSEDWPAMVIMTAAQAMDLSAKLAAAAS